MRNRQDAVENGAQNTVVHAQFSCSLLDILRSFYKMVRDRMHVSKFLMYINMAYRFSPCLLALLQYSTVGKKEQGKWIDTVSFDEFETKKAQNCNIMSSRMVEWDTLERGSFMQFFSFIHH